MKKIEREVMKVVYYACYKDKSEDELTQDKSCVLNQYDILSSLPYKFSIDDNALDENIAKLAIRDYYECKVFFEDGIKKYKFNLLNKGKSFISQIEAEKRMIRIKVIMTVSAPIVSAIIAAIIKAIINK